MKKTRGFTLIELLVVIAIIALLIGILVPALGAARRAANKMKNGTQITAIGKSLALWSQQFYSQSQSYPMQGTLLNPNPSTFGYTIADNDPAHRAGALINMGSDPLSVAMIINPIGTDTAATGSIPSIAITGTNDSYALEEAACPEWKDRTNASMPLIADKQTPSAGKSYWNTKYWEGSVGWGDTHVTYESGHTTTTWPTTTCQGNTTPNDPLFAGGGGAAATDANLIAPGTNQ